MIIVQLAGGMGNQMFQYALGRYLAAVHKTQLKLDVDFFKTYEWHTYSLGPFNTIQDIATYQEIKKLKGNYSTKLFQKIHKLRNKLTHETYWREAGLEFHPEMLALPDNVYLEGYWQSEKYFTSIADIIRKEFTVKLQPSANNKVFLDKIAFSQSVSLHIRRGVYATVPEVNKVHGLCSPEYYKKAIELIKNKYKDIHFFIFSDEIGWAKKNLEIDAPHTFVDQNNDQSDFEDMRMMSYCNHHIIANSTFSWWAAWLCTNPEKTVVMPQKWYNDASRNTKDLMPETWIKL